MVTVICQYTGIQFEAATNRAKNHPVVSELLNAAAKGGNYGQVQSILAQCKKEGIQDIDQVREAVKAGNAKHIAQLNAQLQAEAEDKKAREKARAQRQEQNHFLREHGYTWHKNDDDGYQPMFANDGWHLVSPDNRIVTVAQAMDEIKRGREVVLAEIAALEEAETQVAAANKAKEEADAAAYEQARNSFQGEEVEPFAYDNFMMVARQEYGVSVDKMFRGRVNGVECAVFYHYFGGHNYDERVRYYCVDPAAAGLTPIKRTPLGQTLADFFG